MGPRTSHGFAVKPPTGSLNALAMPLRSIERTQFFGLMRFATLAGMFSLPTHGGNKDFLGWKLLGQEDAMEFKAPFGWYDQPANRRALLGGDA